MYLSDLRTDARYHISPQLTSTDYPDADLDRNLNRWYREMAVWIMNAQGDWELRGDILTRDFKAGVTDYEVPRNFFRIYKGEVMYSAGGTFVPLNFISIQANQDSAEGNATRFIDDPAHPTAEVFGDFIQVRPTIEVGQPDVVNGFKLWAQIDFQDLVNAHDIPDFLEPVHRGLAIGAAMDFCLAEEMYTKYKELKERMYGDNATRYVADPSNSGIKGLIEQLYSTRSGAKRDQLSSRRRSYR